MTYGLEFLYKFGKPSLDWWACVGLKLNESCGYQAMGILHFKGLKGVHKGTFMGKNIFEALTILEQQESDFTLVIQSLDRLSY